MSDHEEKVPESVSRPSANYETFFNTIVEFLMETPDAIFDNVADCLLIHIFKAISLRRPSPPPESDHHPEKG